MNGDFDLDAIARVINDANPDFVALKLKLADKYKNDREAHPKSKTDFIERKNKLARN